MEDGFAFECSPTTQFSPCVLTAALNATLLRLKKLLLSFEKYFEDKKKRSITPKFDDSTREFRLRSFPITVCCLLFKHQIFARRFSLMPVPPLKRQIFLVIFWCCVLLQRNWVNHPCGVFSGLKVIVVSTTISAWYIAKKEE